MRELIEQLEHDGIDPEEYARLLMYRSQRHNLVNLHAETTIEQFLSLADIYRGTFVRFPIGKHIDATREDLKLLKLYKKWKKSLGDPAALQVSSRLLGAQMERMGLNWELMKALVKDLLKEEASAAKWEKGLADFDGRKGEDP